MNGDDVPLLLMFRKYEVKTPVTGAVHEYQTDLPPVLPA